MERLVKCIIVNGTLLPILDEHVGDESHMKHAHIDFRYVENPQEVFGNFKIACYGSYEDAGYHLMKMVNPNIFHDNSFPALRANQNRIVSSPMFQDIQSKCATRTMKSCMKCPHQGLDLSEFPTTEIDGHQVKLCPNHQLAWNLETGKLVKRKLK